MNDKERIVKDCRKLLNAYKEGKLGQTRMPEDSHPLFQSDEERLAYFTLPMALNYQRDSYKLWQASLNAFNDKDSKDIFSVEKVSKMSENSLKEKLLKHKVGLQPNKHTATWKTISETTFSKWGSFTSLMNGADNDYLKLKALIQKEYKKGFPYLSGPKIFNYWSFIISTYGKVALKNKSSIEIAPDTHITQCSVKLGIIDLQEAEALPKEKVSERWREVLQDSDIDPIDMHPPLWFWSRNGFIFELS